MNSVLIVEDDEGLSRGMSFGFSKTGYKVYTIGKYVLVSSLVFS